MGPCFSVFKVKNISYLETHKYAHSILGYSWKDTVPVFMCLELGSFFVQFLVLYSHYNIRVFVWLSSQSYTRYYINSSSMIISCKLVEPCLSLKTDSDPCLCACMCACVHAHVWFSFITESKEKHAMQTSGIFSCLNYMMSIVGLYPFSFLPFNILTSNIC